MGQDKEFVLGLEDWWSQKWFLLLNEYRASSSIHPIMLQAIVFYMGGIGVILDGMRPLCVIETSWLVDYEERLEGMCSFHIVSKDKKT